MKLFDFLKYELAGLKKDSRKFLFGTSIIKYLLLLMLVYAMIDSNRIGLIIVSITMMTVLFWEAYNDNKFLEYRNRQYSSHEDKDMRYWFRRMGIKDKENKPTGDTDGSQEK